MLRRTQAVLVGLMLVLGGVDAGAFVRRGDIILAQNGGLVRLDPTTGVMLPIPTAPLLHQPTGVVVLPDGDLVIADWALPMMDAGSIVRVHVLDGTVTTLLVGLPLNNPFSLARGPDGRIVLGDIDAGTTLALPGNVLRRGALFDLDPTSGMLVRRVQDCCEWNPVGMVFTSATQLLIADAGCCAYDGPGQLATADLETGEWAIVPSPIEWRDPFAIALSSNGATAFVTESSIAEPGPPSVRTIDLATGFTTMLVEGAPLGTPIGMLLEDDGHLLVADESARKVLRIDVATGAVTTVAAGQPITRPATITWVDVGDVVSGVTPGSRPRASCSARAAHDADQLTTRMLRCAAGDATALADCTNEALQRWPVRLATDHGCTTCIETNRQRLELMLPAALLRTPGAHLGCTGGKRGAGRKLARATAGLFTERSGCAADHLTNGRNARRLLHCQETAMAVYRLRTAGRCDDTTLGRIAAEITSMADSLLGAWYCSS
ncbi:MAG TPA: hypothetical protein VGR62_10975 [Candidatus Binatia bacterium]|jgi:hypothetical protein|nr:hypothetical protein [Candidatus Binatia bacterium]